MRHRRLSARMSHRTWIAGATVLLLVSLSPAAIARKAYHSETYQVTLQVESDGSVEVREEIRVRFDGGPFTYFYRGIPLSRTDGIDQIRASDSTRVRRRENRMEVTWTFAACRDTTRTFVVSYRARGVLYDEGGHRRLRWPAFPPGERPYRIDAASATVLFPPGTPPPSAYSTKPGGGPFHPWTRSIEDTALPAASRSGETELTLEPVRLRANHNVVLQVDLPPGALRGTEPAWRLEQLRWKERRPGVLATTGLLLALGLGWIIRTRSDLNAALAPGTSGTPLRGPIPPVSEPPEDVSPALSGALLLGQVTMPHVFAVLFDLSRRGVIKLVPSGSGSRWSSPKPKILRGASSDYLEPWEQTVLDTVFERANSDGSADWGRVCSRLSRRQPAFSRSVQEALVRRGAFDPAGIEGRRVLKRRLLMLLAPEAAAVVAGILLLDTLGPAAFLPVGAIAVVQLVAAVLTVTFPQRTRRGRELARAWKGFAGYLKDAAKGSTSMNAARFATWLPHALALGVAIPWAKAGQRRGLEPPSWFRSESGDLAADMRMLGAMVAITAASAGSSGAHAGGAGRGSSGAG